ncbi:hypothetical protein J7K86_02660 [bacterium]|nr:hypothetical protein [bacterium]
MFLTVHAAAGVLIAQHSKNALIAFFLALLSHYFLDFIPHGDKIFSKSEKHSKLFFGMASFDTIFLVIFLIFIFLHPIIYKNRAIISWGIIGSILPDITYAIENITKVKIFKTLTEPNKFVHNIIKGDLSIKNGLVLQTVVFVLLIIGIFFSLK